MALGQCRKVIRALKLKSVVAADTAGSARIVSESDDKSRAAIASELAAKIYGLKIIKRNIEDEAHNTTRFIVLARQPKWPKPNGTRSKARTVTTFIFQVRNIPAALYKALGGFATNGINMTKLESYMIEGSVPVRSRSSASIRDTGIATRLLETPASERIQIF
jgi:prephenate dehydratase